MKNVIIVGLGKAGWLHYKAYEKIERMGEVYFVDKVRTQKYFEKQQIYRNITELINELNLKSDNVIVDICTPKEEFQNIISESIDCGIENILIEKPFCVDENFFIKKKKLNIIMVENYKVSKITQEIKKIIEKKNYNIKFIYTNFSKSRISDTLNGRGVSKTITSNFEIEIPHQIYVVNFILNRNNFKRQKVVYCKTKDLKIDNVVLKNHAYGLIEIRKDNVVVKHESDLTTNILRKEIEIRCENNILILANYILYDFELNIIQNGKIEVFDRDNMIMEKEFKKDDNMYEFINSVYNQFNNNLIKKSDKKEIIEFSKELNSYLYVLKKNHERISIKSH